MKRSMRYLVLILGLLIALSIYSPMANARNDLSNWDYTLDENGNVTITDFVDYDIVEALSKNLYDVIYVTVPSEIKGHPVTAIGDNAFIYSKSVMEVTIPNSVTSIGKQPFRSDVQIHIETDNPGLAMIDGILYSKADKRLVHCDAGIEADTLVIPNGIKIIGEGSFVCRENIKNIVLPDTVTCIEPRAFACCTAKTINIPDSVAEIGRAAFEETEITTIRVPEGIIELPDSVFEGSKIRSVSLPSTLIRIGDRAFRKCDKLSSIILPSSLQEIGNSAFNGTAIRDISIPAEVYAIGEEAFSSLKTIKIEQGSQYYDVDNNILYRLKDNTLIDYFGSEVTSITVRDGTKTIAKKAFFGSKDLISVLLPKTLEVIEDSAFGYCKNLEQITLPDKLIKIGDNAFSNCEKLREIILPEGLTEIGRSAFAMCSSISSLIIPSTVQEIRDYAFEKCEKLKEVTFFDNNIVFGDKVFLNDEHVNYTVPTGSSAAIYLEKNGYTMDWLNS